MVFTTNAPPNPLSCLARATPGLAATLDLVRQALALRQQIGCVLSDGLAVLDVYRLTCSADGPAVLVRISVGALALVHLPPAAPERWRWIPLAGIAIAALLSTPIPAVGPPPLPGPAGLPPCGGRAAGCPLICRHAADRF
jgi:hypothetical protein